MVNRPLVWAGENIRLERVANTNSWVARVVHRYVAGPTLKETFVPPTDYRYPFMR
jgi:hypothetical protein